MYCLSSWIRYVFGSLLPKITDKRMNFGIRITIPSFGGKLCSVPVDSVRKQKGLAIRSKHPIPALRSGRQPNSYFVRKDHLRSGLGDYILLAVNPTISLLYKPY